MSVGGYGVLTVGRTALILVTGATGFVGRAVVARASLEYEGGVRAAVRRTVPAYSGVQHAIVGDLGGDANWNAALAGVNTVVHAAARVHVMNDVAADPLTEFRRTNVAGTLRLAQQAADAGASRFVFISSIKVNGERTEPGAPFTAADIPRPVDPYGVSKYEAEEALKQLSSSSGLELVIIRPVLVYGPAAKGNFRSMMRWIAKGTPLPLGAIHNRRSIVALDNLVDLILTCVRHPAAADRTFLVSDGEDLSTTELLRRTATAMGKSTPLIPVPAGMLRTAARLVGRGDLAQRLCGSLQVDISSTRELLHWAPPISVDEGLRRAVRTIANPTEDTLN